VTGGDELEALRTLASRHGVDHSYTDFAGEPRHAAPDTLVAVLRALGVGIDSPAESPSLLATRDHDDAPIVPAVVVAWDRDPVRAPLRVPSRAPNRVVECGVRLERGGTVEWRTRVSELDGGEGSLRVLEVPEPLPWGVHHLRVVVGDRTAESIVVTAPRRGARSGALAEGAAWGAFLPLPAVRTGRAGATGDLGDLGTLADVLAEDGARVVATLPLLAAFLDPPAEPSPYSPVSRRFWNELYLDLEQIPDLRFAPDAAAMLASPSFATEYRELREQPDVDYERAAALRRRVLERLAGGIADGPPGRLAAFRDFLADHPEVTTYARFRATAERHGRQWRQWPVRMRDGIIGFTDVDPVADHYHRYVQWIAHEQLGDLAARLHRRGQSLALDLPLGCHPDGYDVWIAPQRFAAGMSVGAPPDQLAPDGQVWGFPPAHPVVARADGHADFRLALIHHMQHAGVLRLDHVMGLHRLWCVPDGMPAASGAYVRYPAEELWALVCLEAYRHEVDVVGEDLGTVPGEVTETMRDHGAFGMYVGQFAGAPDRHPPLLPPHADQVAMWGTHDMPTFAGWWATAPVEVRRAWRDTAQDDTPTPDDAVDDAGPSPAVVDAVHGALATSDAALVTVNLADLWAERTPVNVPGTVQGNWSRKAARTVEELRDDERLQRSLRVLEERRPLVVRGPSRSLTTATSPTNDGHDRFSDLDLHLFAEGRHHRLYDLLGSHPVRDAGGARHATAFGVWAPDAIEVSVIGDFNDWRAGAHPLVPVRESGIWSGVIEGVTRGDRYKYAIRPRNGRGNVGRLLEKADPFAFHAEEPPRTASIVWDLDHQWRDGAWMGRRPTVQGADRPLSVYEVHLGSWRRVPEEGNRRLTYRELAPLLSDYVQRMGYTHVELLPVMEHPFYGSWGYQTTGYFAPSSRYGTPQDFMYLVDHLHRRGIGVVLDWVPSHFPNDAHGLAAFDGSHLYEHADPRQRVHPDWDTYIFNYGRNEVRSFLTSCALFWTDVFHVDGLRTDAVASMLYRDYSRRAGEWVPNRFGGRENLEAIDFLRDCNAAIGLHHPDVLTFAEESTAWPGVTRPADHGGLGFWFKWDMGWMHDTLEYFKREPVHRTWHHDELTFRAVYAESEQFTLPLSHDEVVHGKRSLLGRMPGDDWQRFANLRLLLGYQWALPGKKLLFMGGDFGDPSEWHHERSLPWHLLEQAPHAGISRWVQDLNRLHREVPALYERDRSGGFEWIDANDRGACVLTWLRNGEPGRPPVIVAANFTPVPRPGYRVGTPTGGAWTLLANSDDATYGGSGYAVPDTYEAAHEGAHGRPHSLELTLPPLGIVLLTPRGD
jgi:alpha-1,4-glucan:alpha-1,4-glucan 6-glycosyltransferase/4-alpha-glucanotransferase